MKGAIVFLALATVVLAESNVYVPRHHSTRHHGYDTRYSPEVYRLSPEVYRHSPEVYRHSPEVYRYSPETSRYTPRVYTSGYPKVYEVFPKESEVYSRPVVSEDESEETVVTVEKRPETETDNTVDVDVVLRKPTSVYRRKDQQGSYVARTIVPTTYDQRIPYGQTIRIPYGVPRTVYGQNTVYGEPRTVYGQNTIYGEPRTVYGQNTVFGEPRTIYGEPRTTYGEPTSYGVPIRSPYGQPNVYYGQQRTPSVYEQVERVGKRDTYPYVVPSPYYYNTVNTQYPYVSSPLVRALNTPFQRTAASGQTVVY